MLTVFLALAAATANAGASTLQRKAAGRVPDREALRPALIFHLFHYPIWFAGIGAVFVAFLLQAAALSTGAVVLVQSVLVIELPLTLLFSALILGSRLGRREWAAVVVMALGLSAILAAAAPGGGTTRLSAIAWVVGICASVSAICLLFVLGKRSAGAGRGAFLGTAAGTTFGLTAALMKAMTTAFKNGFVAGLRSWQLYAMICGGIVAMFLLQNALQAGRLAATQPGLTLSDPITATIWGVALFGESFRTGLLLVPELIGAALIALGVVLLVESPLLSGESGRHED